MKLTKIQRIALEAYVLDVCMSDMFGDGMERDYIMDGFPSFKGIKYMSDTELIKEANGHCDPDEVAEFLKGIGK